VQFGNDQAILIVDMAARDDEKRPGLSDTAGRAAFFPARVAARAWRERLESAAEDVVSAPEVARIVDRALAGPLPEEFARSLVRHRVLERVVRELAESGELERLVKEALESPRTLELTDSVLASDEMHHTLASVTSSPEVRRAVARQSAGLGDELVAGVRTAAVRFDDRAEHAVRRRERPVAAVYAGIGSRAVALAIDAFIALGIFVTGSAVVALIASLVGGIRPQWLAGALLSVAWVIVGGGYFVLFWSAAGQTPGMRLMRLRVRRVSSGGLSIGRAVVRVIGLALAIIPLFAGFIPVLFDNRRRGLPDYLAGTVVVYDHAVALEADPSRTIQSG
jgi:uncharacterized RDD family membrane protein YckC